MLDHDDGGWRYADENNVCVYGTIENHDGTEKDYRHNLIVFPGIVNHSQYAKPCFEDTPDIEHTELSANNTLKDSTCFVSTDAPIITNGCNASRSLLRTISVRSANNTFVTPTGAMHVQCNCAATPGSPKTCAGSNTSVGSTNLTLDSLQRQGIDKGSTVGRLPDSAEVLCTDIIQRVLSMLSGS